MALRPARAREALHGRGVVAAARAAALPSPAGPCGQSVDHPTVTSNPMKQDLERREMRMLRRSVAAPSKIIAGDG